MSFFLFLLAAGLQLPYGSNQSTDPEPGFKQGGPACKSSVTVGSDGRNHNSLCCEILLRSFNKEKD